MDTFNHLHHKERQKIIKTHHKNIKDNLNAFILNNKIPNILLYGNYGSGKKTLLNDFFHSLYGTNELRDKYIMYINCAHGKGIKFIRDEVKFFAMTNIITQHTQHTEDTEDTHNTHHKKGIIKSIVLLNADKLTIDAQSALRRCIELFSKNTRFYIVIENKDNLIKPILSRFCCIYVPSIVYKNTKINLYQLKSIKMNASHKTFKIKKLNDVFYRLTENEIDTIELCNLVDDLYNDAITGLDVIEYIKIYMPDNCEKYTILFHLDKIRNEYKNEKLFLCHILTIYLMRNDNDLENICKV